MGTRFVDYLSCPLGTIGIFADEQHITGIEFVSSKEKVADVNALTEMTKTQLNEYFCGNRKVFDVPINLPDSSAFCRAVYQILVGVSFGATLTYKELASLSGSPLAYRAAGSWIGKNPYVIVIPCHRIVASNRKIGGFSYGTDIKRKLLQLEGIIL